MKSLLLAAFFTIGAAAAERLPDLTSGRYELTVEGLLCRSCAQAISDELLKQKEVVKVQPDFDHEALIVTIRPGHVLTQSKLSKCLSKAASRIDLGTKFRLKAVKYLV